MFLSSVSRLLCLEPPTEILTPLLYYISLIYVFNILNKKIQHSITPDLIIHEQLFIVSISWMAGSIVAQQSSKQNI